MSINPDIDYSDRSEIAGLLAAYAFGLDRRDFDRVASVFTEDAYVENVFDAYMPDGALLNSVTIGGSAVADGARQMFTRLDATQHLLGAQIVEISGATAHASTQVIAHHHRGKDHYYTGATYEDDFARTPDGWHISRRIQRIHWATGNPDVVLAP